MSAAGIALNRFDLGTAPASTDVPAEHASYFRERRTLCQQAQMTDTPFVERLMHLWANHFAVSALATGALYEHRDLKPTMSLDALIAGATAMHFWLESAARWRHCFRSSAAAGW